MPKDERGQQDERKRERLVRVDVMILHFLWKTGGHKGSISKLSDELGYPEDSYVNRRINALKDDGYVEEKSGKFEVTKEGQRKIFFLIWPFYILVFLAVLAGGLVFWGLSGLLFGLVLPPLYLLIEGSASLIFLLFVLWMDRKVDERLWRGR